MRNEAHYEITVFNKGHFEHGATSLSLNQIICPQSRIIAQFRKKKTDIKLYSHLNSYCSYCTCSFVELQ